MSRIQHESFNWNSFGGSAKILNDLTIGRFSFSFAFLFIGCPKSVSVIFSWLNIDMLTEATRTAMTSLGLFAWACRASMDSVGFSAQRSIKSTFWPVVHHRGSPLRLFLILNCVVGRWPCCHCMFTARLTFQAFCVNQYHSLMQCTLIGYLVIIVMRRLMPIVCGRYHIFAKRGKMLGLHTFVDRLVTSGVRPLP